MSEYIYKGIMQKNADVMADRVKIGGLFNIIVIFGPTRSGKSTLAFQIAKHISEKLGVPFTVDNIHFDAEEYIKFLTGKKFYVGVLDEAAFDMKGEDWYNKASKKLRKYINTAAKFNQTLIICIPKLGSIHSDFVTDFHSRGIRTHISYKQKPDGTNVWTRGVAKGYVGEKFFKQWEHEKKFKKQENELWVYEKTIGPFQFSKNISFIDEAAYQKKKEKAIESLDEDYDKNDDRLKVAKLAKFLKEEKNLPYREIASILDVHENTIGNLIRKYAPLEQ